MIGHEGIKTYPDQQFCDAIGQADREVTCIDHRLIFALQSWSNHTFFYILAKSNILVPFIRL